MSKRFTDTDKWKKPFIRGLQGAYKLLWFYILDDCDHAGIWQVDFEVAQIRIGENVSEEEAIKIFGDRIEVFHNGAKWFIPDFIEFQYGNLTEKNRMHLSVINLLQKNEVGAYKPLGWSQGIIQGQGNGQEHGQEHGQGKGQGAIALSKNEIFEEIFTDEIWIEQISMTHKGKDIKQSWEECYTHHAQNPNAKHFQVWEWKQKLNTWLTIKKSENGKSGTFKKEHPAEAAARNFAERYGSKPVK